MDEKISYKLEIVTNKAEKQIEDLFHSMDESGQERFSELFDAMGEALNAESVEDLDNALKTIYEQWRNIKDQVKETGDYYDVLQRKTADISSTLTGRAFILEDSMPKTGLFGGLKNSLSSIWSTVKGTATSAFNGLKETISDMVRSTDNLTGSVSTFGEIGSRSMEKVKNSMFRVGLGMMGMGSAFSGLRKAVSAYLADNETVANRINSIWATLGNTLAPIINFLSSKIESLLNTTMALLNVLFGASFKIKKATGATSGQAKATEDLADATEEANRQLAGFDEMNVLQDTSKKDSSVGDVDSGGAGSGYMLIDPDTAKVSDKLLKIAENLKKAWKEAWEYNDNGKAIMETLSKIMDHIRSTISRIVDATVEWSERLNLIPLVTGIRSVLEAIEPIVGKIGDVLVFIWERAVLPIATWVLESALPAFLEMVAGALDLIDATLEVLKPILEYIWDNIVTPIAGAIGEMIVGVLNDIANACEVISQWMKDNKEQAEAIMIVLTTLIGVWVLYKTTLGLVDKACGLIQLAMGHPLLTAIALLVVAVVFLINHWDEVKEVAVKAWEKIKQTWQNVGNWFNTTVVTPVKTFFSGLGTAISTFFTSAWNTVRSVWSAVTGWFTNSIINPVRTGFNSLGANIGNFMSNAWNTARGAWSAATGFFNGIFTNVRTTASTILNTIASTFSSAYSRITSAWSGFTSFFSRIWSGIGNIAKSAVNGVIRVLNGMSFTVPSWVPWYGGQSFGFNIPYLAEGGIAVRPTSAVIGEAGKEAVLPLENNTEWMDRLADKLADKINSGTVVLQLDGKTIAKNQIKWQNKLGFSSNT